METKPEKFNGPVFLSGMPRSGTKLLRDLLNNHSRVAIPENESLFLPKAIRRFGSGPAFNPSELTSFWTYFSSTKFFGNQVERGLEMDRSKIYEEEPSDWEALIGRLFLYCSPKPITADIIWGDKTPGYVLHIDLLMKAFPNARFVHIVRDPRDYACSVRNAWGRSIYRAAERWGITMRSVRQCKAITERNYLEVKYEELIQSPEVVLERICKFLEIGYESGMDNLKRQTENLGDAKGETRILAGNTGKFISKLSKAELYKVESIVLTEMINYGYQPVSDSVVQTTLSSSQHKYYRVVDAFASFRFHVGQRGLLAGTSYFYKLYKDHSWRNTEAD